MNWLKRVLAFKIHITIVIPPSTGVVSSTTPKIVEETIITNRHKSDYRFACDTEIDHTGEETVWYFTQEYKKGSWNIVSNSLSRNKEKAMNLHLKIIEQGSLEPRKTRTVLWEGLSKEETKTWVELNK